MTRRRVLLAGAGGMGSAVGLLLRELGDFEIDLFIGDSDGRRAEAAAAWIREGSTRPGEVRWFHLPAALSSAAFDQALAESELLLDCLPGREAPRMALLALKHRLHYANLTEHVRETNEVIAMAAGAERGFVLQTGLAPGFIDVLGNGLFQRFCRDYGVTTAEVMQMRVGALTTTARPPHYYGFTWSSIGVATEYVEPATVIRDGKRTTRPSLSDRETILIHGVLYEEALTSGGAADLPQVLAGRLDKLDYKTLRYPGHYSWVQSILDEAPGSVDRAEYLLRRMEQEVPFVDDDLVTTYAAVEGRAADGSLRRLEDARVIRPCRIGARALKAIQATTAAGLAESAHLLLQGGYKGICQQSQIDPLRFLSGPFVSAIYGKTP
jgi:saccharopine dehydrogenase-like NADP-dependent oxidoreductase